MTSASFVPSATSSVSVIDAPVVFATSLQYFTSSSFGKYFLFVHATKSMPSFAHVTMSELPMLYLASPMYTNFTPLSLPRCSRIVSISAIICVGWNSFVRPFHTGTPAYFASSSTISCPYPRYSIPSNILPSTRAVSAMLSFLPICEPLGSRYVTCIPRSCAATSKEQRVLVLVFSKISAMFLPVRSSCLMPFFFFSFSSCERSIR